MVDGNQKSRLALESMLGGFSPQTTSTGRAAEAIEILADGRYQAVVADAKLEDGDGFEVVRAAMRLRPEIPFVMLFHPRGLRSGSEKCQQPGLRHHLLKPVGENDLIAVLARALGRTSAGETAGKSEHSSSCIAHMRILVAEDNPVNQKVATRLLEKTGHHVVVVSDGAAAVREAQSGAFDVILMDIQMPVLDGFDAAREIRRIENGTGWHVPIVALTAHAMQGDREKCLSAGMDDYLSKPLQLREVNRVLHRVSTRMMGIAVRSLKLDRQPDI
ncbi:MAG TPA: response regulator [Bryobacteraceae bacterium]|nr:response regulator [Bryobacteraceae bacterium]